MPQMTHDSKNQLPPDEARAFAPRYAALEHALETPPPAGVHDWQPGGVGFKCSRCGAGKSVRVPKRGLLRGTTVALYHVGGKKFKREPRCK